MKENVTREAVVVVIDDDASVRAALKDLFEFLAYSSNSTHREVLFWRIAFQTLRAAWCSM